MEMREVISRLQAGEPIAFAVEVVGAEVDEVVAAAATVFQHFGHQYVAGAVIGGGGIEAGADAIDPAAVVIVVGEGDRAIVQEEQIQIDRRRSGRPWRGRRTDNLAPRRGKAWCRSWSCLANCGGQGRRRRRTNPSADRHRRPRPPAADSAHIPAGLVSTTVFHSGEHCCAISVCGSASSRPSRKQGRSAPIRAKPANRICSPAD